MVFAVQSFERTDIPKSDLYGVHPAGVVPGGNLSGQEENTEAGDRVQLPADRFAQHPNPRIGFAAGSTREGVIGVRAVRS